MNRLNRNAALSGKKDDTVFIEFLLFFCRDTWSLRIAKKKHESLLSVIASVLLTALTTREPSHRVRKVMSLCRSVATCLTHPNTSSLSLCTMKMSQEHISTQSHFSLHPPQLLSVFWLSVWLMSLLSFVASLLLLLHPAYLFPESWQSVRLKGKATGRFRMFAIHPEWEGGVEDGIRKAVDEWKDSLAGCIVVRIHQVLTWCFRVLTGKPCFCWTNFDMTLLKEFFS